MFTICVCFEGTLYSLLHNIWSDVEVLQFGISSGWVDHQFVLLHNTLKINAQIETKITTPFNHCIHSCLKQDSNFTLDHRASSQSVGSEYPDNYRKNLTKITTSFNNFTAHVQTAFSPDVSQVVLNKYFTMKIWVKSQDCKILYRTPTYTKLKLSVWPFNP